MVMLVLYFLTEYKQLNQTFYCLGPTFARTSQEGAKLATIRREILKKVKSSMAGKTSRKIDDLALSKGCILIQKCSF